MAVSKVGGQKNKNGPLLAQGGPLIGEKNSKVTDVVDQRAQEAPSSSSSAATVIGDRVMTSI